MILSIADVLSATEVANVRAGLATARFEDGRVSAGWTARLVKQNLQATDGPDLERVRGLIEARLLAHAVFVLAARPKRLLGPVFSRYAQGHAYGAHVDDALMAGVRTDLSFTLFLSAPGSYDGGALIVDTPGGEEVVKLSAGSVALYPASNLHRVEAVIEGERLAAVGWVRSYIRDPLRRELLFDLETARRRLFDREGKTAEGDLLAKCAANLFRLWCDD
jgi:PKHD-type hydroxylase